MKRKGYCKNGHAIGSDQIVLLNHVVGVCSCGYKYLVECMPATHIKDVYNKTKEKFHVYVYLAPLVCPSCYHWIIRMSIACHPLKDTDWRTVLEERILENSYEDLCRGKTK